MYMAFEKKKKKQNKTKISTGIFIVYILYIHLYTYIVMCIYFNRPLYFSCSYFFLNCDCIHFERALAQ